MSDGKKGAKLYCNHCHSLTPHLVIIDKEENIVYAYCLCGNLKIVDNWE